MDGAEHAFFCSDRARFGSSDCEKQCLPCSAGGPVAWLHKDYATAYVITNRVKDLWEKVDQKHVQNYTVPLFSCPIYAVDPALRSADEQKPEERHTTDDEARLLHDVLNQARETLLISIKGTPEELQRSLGKLNLACKAHWDWKTTLVCERCGLQMEKDRPCEGSNFTLPCYGAMPVKHDLTDDEQRG
jgi:hypothetical protein